MCFLTLWILFKCLTNSSTSVLLISPLSNCLNSKAFQQLFPQTTWNGDFPVLLLIELLYKNFAYGKIISQSFGLSLTKHLIKLPKL